MIKYRKIRIVSDNTVCYDSDLCSDLVGMCFDDEVEFLDTICFTEWKLVTIVDDHQTFIFSSTR